MARTFNCGVGMVLVTSTECQEEVLHILRSAGEDGAAVIGKLNTHTGKLGVFSRPQKKIQAI